MIYIIAVASLLAGFVPTRIYHVKRINKIRRDHAIDLVHRYYAAYKAGHEIGIRDGKIQQIRKILLAK